MTSTPAESNATTRASFLARDANYVWVAQVLRLHQQEILDRWLEAAANQSFHLERPEHAVADDIPRLLDALIQFLLQHGPASIDAGAPLDEPNIRAAAQRHAQARALQGLSPSDVVVEFRLLRQEIWRSLRTGLPETAPPDDIMGAALLINDALDGAITLGIDALLDRIELARQQLITTIMHDLRTPITAVKGWAQLILRKEHPAPSMAQPILDAANRLQYMTDDMLEIGHLAAGQIELNRERIDLVALTRSAIDALGLAAGEHQIRLEASSETVFGDWDGERLHRVLQNLLTNAVKYSPSGTEILVSVTDLGHAAELRVQDHGLGIPPDSVARIFDQFYRVREHASGAEGLGLGLYIAQTLVEAHGGQIRAESDGPGQGSTFALTLPYHG
ncbi:MAG: sensor histidine kinase [Chloroflexota bacterium]